MPKKGAYVGFKNFGRKKNCHYLQSYIYNLGHNILRLFDVLPNFLLTTSETNRDY